MKRLSLRSGMDTLSWLLCPEQDHRPPAGGSSQLNESHIRQHLRVSAEREFLDLLCWFASFAMGMCPASKVPVATCPGCQSGLQEHEEMDRTVSLNEARRLLAGSRFVGGAHCSAPHRQEIGEASLAKLWRAYSTLALAPR